MKYSQNDEQDYITTILQNTKGRLLDIGAYDGITFSNSYQLLLNGWKGILIEPAPSVINHLLKNTTDIKDNIEIVNAAITPNSSSELLKFYDANTDAVSTSDENHKKIWEKNINYRKVYVPTITIQDIFRTFGTNFEFINIDVEGQNPNILETIPLNETNTKVICIEHQHEFDRITNYVSKFGFKKVHMNGENIIFEKQYD